MTGEIIHTVFVSSTYEDLREERAEVQKALLKFHCFPIGMELFPSADEETWDFIKRQIAGADYYLVIIAGRYGSLAPDGISFTEKEYDYAREIRKPVLAFVHGDPGNIPISKCESEIGLRQRLDKFIAKVKRSPVGWFKTPHELSTQVLASLVELRDRHPAAGFIRADQAADYKKYSELLEENTRLKTELTATGTEPIKFRMADEMVALAMRIGQDVQSIERTWAQIFVFVAEQIITQSDTDYEIKNALANHACSPSEGDWAESDAFDRIKKRLVGLGLVSFQTVTPPPRTDPNPVIARLLSGRSYHRWLLTDFGTRQYGLLTTSSSTDVGSGPAIEPR